MQVLRFGNAAWKIWVKLILSQLQKRLEIPEPYIVWNCLLVLNSTMLFGAELCDKPTQSRTCHIAIGHEKRLYEQLSSSKNFLSRFAFYEYNMIIRESAL